MEIASKYDPSQVEGKWYQYWMEHQLFKSVPDHREPYTIVIPPPNVTGVLHMGHMLNNTIQDILVRRARMMGKNACWVPGTDHASIATEAKVVAKLAGQGIKKSDLTRDQFIEHAWEWTHKHGGIILEQLKKLGASCDWDRTCFTMDEARSQSVMKVFVDLYNKGLIYRSVRMVNWDPKAKTAVSDEEVNYKEVNSKLYYIRYRVENSAHEYVTIATTRPETILGDTAVCINPNDVRFRHLKGKNVLVPLINRSVPVIEDEYVDMEFGTGCLKITPAHDPNDYEIGIRHNLDCIDILNDDGTLNDNAILFVGEDRFTVRDKIVTTLKESGNLVKIEDYVNKVGFSERTDVPIEPKLSMQWFLKMKELAKPALDAVMNDEIKFYPSKFKNLYRHWMENVKDWNISRQLWWGHRIPAWTISPNPSDRGESHLLPSEGLRGTIVVAENEEEARRLAGYQSTSSGGVDVSFSQDEDCLDTWFSSWLWPISGFDGINHPDNEDINYYYPTNDLVTAPEIIFFWVARMIISGYEYRNKPCFRNVYFTGIVRDKSGRKMSKQLGNSPDPIELMEKYSADGVRMGMLLMSPAGNDLPFDESLCDLGRNFNNKIWNALRLVKGWKVVETGHTLSLQPHQSEAARIAVAWFEARLCAAIEQINDEMDKYRISEALMSVYKLFWDEFSSWYLEMIKPAYQQPVDAVTYQATLAFFEKLVVLLHPFMPFITEEVWQSLGERKEGDSIMIAAMPEVTTRNEKIITEFEIVKQIIAGVRSVRLEHNIPNRDPLVLNIVACDYNDDYNAVIMKICNLERIEHVEKDMTSASFMVGTMTFAVPLESVFNMEEEIKKMEDEIKYLEGFLRTVEKKLSNEKFIAKADPKVVAIERKKQADAKLKITNYKLQITNRRQAEHRV